MKENEPCPTLTPSLLSALRHPPIRFFSLRVPAGTSPRTQQGQLQLSLGDHVENAGGQRLVG